MGYFQSERGLTQGDPISPYLFLIAMEVFSLLFAANIKEKGYDYHPKSGQLGLSQVAFADDFLILAAKKSFQVIKETNRSKCQGFGAGMGEDSQKLLCDWVQMSGGTLPVKDFL